jgi:hypothetical protein
MVMGMLRLQNKTDGYWVMSKYGAMKEHKGTGKSIIATARKMSTVVYAILKTRQTFDPSRMLPKPKYVEMSKGYALAI